MLTAVIASYIPMGVHTLLRWPMSPTSAYKQSLIDSIRSLIDGEANGGLAGADICMLKYTDQYADEYARHQ